jgi:hypothetical protein
VALVGWTGLILDRMGGFGWLDRFDIRQGGWVGVAGEGRYEIGWVAWVGWTGSILDRMGGFGWLDRFDIRQDEWLWLAGQVRY